MQAIIETQTKRRTHYKKEEEKRNYNICKSYILQRHTLNRNQNIN